MTYGLRVEAMGTRATAVLNLLDARTGRVVGLPSEGRRGVRLRVDLACPEGRIGWTEARTLVVADVLVRALEAAGVQVIPALAVPELPPEQAEALDRVLSRYGVNLPAAEDPPRVADLHVHTGSAAPADGPGVSVPVGPVTTATGTPDPALSGPGEDPAAGRLTLLGTAHRDPLALDADVLGHAVARLAGWRTLVRAWSHTRSAPVPAPLHDRARQALATDLDTPGLLSLLDETADAPDLSDGSRFESFVWLDRFLGLDLSRDLAHP